MSGDAMRVVLETREWRDEFGYVQFVAEITGRSSAHIAVDVFQITSWTMDRDPEDREHYCDAYMKRDGCCHVFFGDTRGDGHRDGYLHLCGVKCWKDHAAVMEWLYRIAEETIPTFDASEGWDFVKPREKSV